MTLPRWSRSLARAQATSTPVCLSCNSSPRLRRRSLHERITASHANLLARLPQERAGQPPSRQCWRKDWQDKEAHLLPAKHLSAWIQTNLYLSLADAPFDTEDPTLNPTAGACVTCPRRSGFNTALFVDVQGDQCLDSPCYQVKINVHIDREVAAHPDLIQIENGYRSPKEQRPGAVQRGVFREIETVTENPDAEPAPPCVAAKSAIIVFGKRAGTAITVCTDNHCAVHDPRAAARQTENPVPTMPPPPEAETDEEAEERNRQHEQEQKEYEAERERRAEAFREQRQREQQEYEEEQIRREEQRKIRLATFERIIEQAPASLNQAQMRVFLRLLIHLDYSFLEEVANHFAKGDENSQMSDEEVVQRALDGTADEKLTGFALRLVLSDHVDIAHENQPDLLTEAEQVFVPKKPKAVKAKADAVAKPKPKLHKATARKEATPKKAA